jgi:hypothetical protein
MEFLSHIVVTSQSMNKKILGYDLLWLCLQTSKRIDKPIDIKSLKIDCLRFVVCPLLVPAFQVQASSFLFFSFFVAVAIYSTNKANKAGSTRR